jgi:hypothetical protein
MYTLSVEKAGIPHETHGDENYELIGITWPDTKSPEKIINSKVTFPEKFSFNKIEAQTKAEQQVVNFLNDAHQFMRNALSIQNLDKIEVTKNLEGSGVFRIDEDGSAHLRLSQEWFDTVTSYVSWLLEGKRQPDEKVELQSKPGVLEKMDYGVAVGAAISYITYVLAHEMYHARQAFQDPDYYNETLEENVNASVARGMSQEKGDYWNKRAERIYNNSQGEKAADGFALRFLREYKKRLMSKNDNDRAAVEKLYLLGVDRLSNDLIAEIKERFRSNK